MTIYNAKDAQSIKKEKTRWEQQQDSKATKRKLNRITATININTLRSEFIQIK